MFSSAAVVTVLLLVVIATIILRLFIPKLDDKKIFHAVCFLVGAASIFLLLQLPIGSICFKLLAVIILAIYTLTSLAGLIIYWQFRR